MKPHKTTATGEIKLLNIPVGATVTTECPACGKSKLSVTNKDGTGYVYNCFRASCGFKGYAPLVGVGTWRTSDYTKPGSTVRPFSEPMFSLCRGEAEFLRGRVGFTEEHIAASGVRITEHGAYAYPIMSKDRTIKGYHLRYYDGRTPKAHTHLISPTVTKSSWYTKDEDDTVFLVEDIPSAVRLSMYKSVVALLGTTLAAEDIMSLSARFSNVVIALDPDAAETALWVRNSLDGWFDNVDIALLNDDLKDMSEDEVQTFAEQCSYI